jgi:hypothetical protein
MLKATSDGSLNSSWRTLCTSSNVEAPVMDLLEAWTAGDAASAGSDRDVIAVILPLGAVSMGVPEPVPAG